MTKRNLFAEMTEGFDALAAARKGKKTLRTTDVTVKPAAAVSAEDLSAIGETQSVAPSVCMLPEN